MEDKTAEITDYAGLDYNFKKVYKIGKQVFITMRCKNGTGSTITGGSTLFILGTSIRPGLALYLMANVSNQSLLPVNMAPTGEVSLIGNLADNAYVTFTFCYSIG